MVWAGGHLHIKPPCIYAYLYIILCTPQIAYCPGNCTGAVNGQQKKNKHSIIKKLKKNLQEYKFIKPSVHVYKGAHTQRI
jgi:hypothetical protein